MYESFQADLVATMPIIVVAVAGMLIVVIESFRKGSRSLPVVAELSLFVAGIWEVSRLERSAYAFDGLMGYGGFASFMNAVIIVAAFLTIPITVPYLRGIRRNFGEIYALVLFATVGMMILASANNLITVFVGLETMSICLYVLTGMVRENPGATESALKYFLLGAFATGFFLYGMALLYGATGTMDLGELGSVVQHEGMSDLFWTGLGLLLVGFFFKVSAVPMHMWTPDVYQGAPTTLTGFMATGSKTAAFAALLAVLGRAAPFGVVRWSVVLATVALLTMVVGNVLALRQNNVKRMLAYSSIAHAGYVLVGIAAGTAEAYSGVLYYLLVYTLMNLGAFGVMSVLEWDGQQGSSQTLQSLSGIGLRKPLLATLMGVFMFSLAGFPPLAGFFAKFRVFAPAVDAGLTWLVVVGVLASILSAFYYLRVLFVFWFKSADEEPEAAPVLAIPFQASLVTVAVLVLCAVAQLVLFFMPGEILQTASSFFATGEFVMLP
jgi:NADH-quinone oxidoreductase subunit N